MCIQPQLPRPGTSSWVPLVDHTLSQSATIEGTLAATVIVLACLPLDHLTSTSPLTLHLVSRDPHSDWLPRVYALPSSAVPSSSPSSLSSQSWRSSSFSPHACVPSHPSLHSPLEAIGPSHPAQWPAPSSRSRLRRRLSSPILQRPWARVPTA